jgi:tetratricopeptide (TPR) repeat protein
MTFRFSRIFNGLRIPTEYSKAMEYVRKRDFAEALSCLERVLHWDDTFYLAWSDKGNILHNLGRDQEGLDCYERAIRLNPSYVAAWYNKGLCLMDMARMQEAAESFKQALKLDPDDAEIWAAQSACQSKSGDNDGALYSLDRALNLRPRYDVALVNRGVVLLEMQRPADALASFNECLIDIPDQPGALEGKGNALQEMGRYSEALECYDRALAIKPDDGNLWNSKGNALTGLSQIKQANDCYKKAVYFKPDSASARFNLADYFQFQAKYEDAIAQLKEAIRLKPDFARAYNMLGRVYVKLNKIDLASVYFEQAQQLDPEMHSPITRTHSDIETTSRHPKFSENANTGLKAFNDEDFYKGKEYLSRATSENSDPAALFLIYWLLGGCNRRLGFLEVAVDNLLSSLNHAKGQIERDVARVYNDLAITLEMSERDDDALDAIKKAIALQPDYINACLFGANLCLNKPDFSGVLTFATQAVELATDADAVRMSSRETETASEVKLMADRYASQALTLIGFAYWGQGDIERALQNLNQALDTNAYIPLATKAVTCISEGQSFTDYQQEERASTEAENEAVRIHSLAVSMQEEPKLRALWETHERLISEAMELHRRGQFAEAVRKIEAARKALPERNAETEHAGCDNIVSYIAMEQGEHEDALRLNQKVLDEYDKIGWKRGRLQALTNQGLFLLSTGDYSKSLNASRKGLKLALELGEMSGVGANLGNIGISYSGLGDLDRAIEAHQQALAIDIQYRLFDSKARDNGNLASCYARLMFRAQNDQEFEQYAEKAKLYQNRILDFYRRAHTDRFMEMKALAGLAEIQLEIGRRTGSKALLWGSLNIIDEAIAIAHNMSNQSTLLGMLTLKGELFRAFAMLSDSPEEALGYLNTSESYLRDVNARIAVAVDRRYELAQTYETYLHWSSQNRILRYQQAFLCYEDGIRGINRGRQKVHQQDLKISYLGHHDHLFRDSVALCMNMHSEGIATPNGDPRASIFEFVESCKSRTLLDMLGGTASVPPAAMRPEHSFLFEQEATCLTQLRSLRLLGSQPAVSDNTNNEAELSMVKQLDQIYDEMERNYPQYVSIRRGKPTSANELRSYLEDDAAVLEYFVTEKTTYILVLTVSDPVPVIYELPYGNSYWKKIWDELRTSIAQADPSDTIFFEREIADFYALGEMLVGCALDRIGQKRLLYVIPHGPLHYLPIHGMKINIDGVLQYCAQRFEIVYLPSASTLGFCRRNNPYRKGNTDIAAPLVCGTWASDDRVQYREFIQKEAETIAALFSVQPLTGLSCSKKRAIEEMDRADNIHFATHGYYIDSENAMASTGILLSNGCNYPAKPDKRRFLQTVENDAFLSAQEWMQLSLYCHLVTLSACETGRPYLKPGDELMGFSRALLYSGTPSVLYSIWPVNAKSKLPFMTRFYENWRSNRDGGKSCALKMTQGEMIRHPDYGSFYHWAPYFLVGDWL